MMKAAVRCISTSHVLRTCHRPLGGSGARHNGLNADTLHHHFRALESKRMVATSSCSRRLTVMMGRKSAKIANKKGKTDAAKAKLYGKFGKLIAQEARSGGADPSSNGKLKDVLAQAKSAQVPADIIERNLKKAEDKSGGDFSEMVYEAYGPGGTGFIIEALTDNVNRTAAEVRTAVTKSGGKMADSGSVLFNFSRTGLVMVSAEEDEDATFEAAIDAGASDVEPSDEGYRVLTSLEDYASVSSALHDVGIQINAESSGLVYVPLSKVELGDDDVEANETMYDKILDVDDVDAVFSNYL